MTIGGTIEHERLIRAYLAEVGVPWSPGYKPFRMRLLQEIVRDPHLLLDFGAGRPLPHGYGFGIDERVVEYPWALSQLDCNPGLLMDAGSTLNYPYLLDLPQLHLKTVVIMTLAPEWMEKRANVSYLYGDLRDIILRDSLFQWIVCISTLEHVGLDNTMLYTSDPSYKETRAQDYGNVMREFRRVLAPGGRLLLTVPFGRAHNLGWMQQFDVTGLEDIANAFGSLPQQTAFYQYMPTGWVRSDQVACAECKYFDVHTATAPAPDLAAAARAVACMAFTKDSS